MTGEEQSIRRGYEAWNRGDWAAMEELLATDFEVDATDRVLNPDRFYVDRDRALAAAGLSDVA
jgi:ketosteroid isomerase-like protein